MKLKIFNTLKKRIDTIEMENSKFSVYLCGPTVYDHIHLGNLRPVIIFDVIIRLLRNLKIDYYYVQNITDIDDKIIEKSQKIRKSEKVISEKYSRAYFKNLVNYNIILADNYPRITKHLKKMEVFIDELIKKNFAYQSNDGVYFNLKENLENLGYGSLSGQILKKLKKQEKHNGEDFALWKKTGNGINWKSDWGEGRPGWHTECATIIRNFFDEFPITLHGGGVDLIFPHHENERAQFWALENKEISKYWFHVAHLLYGKEKMSKSLGNVITAKWFRQNYDPDVFRYIVLNSHHNQVLNLEEELIKQGQKQISKINSILKRTSLYFFLNSKKEKEEKEEKDNFVEKIRQCLLDNINTIKALYLLEERMKIINNLIDNKASIQIVKNKISSFLLVLNLLGFNKNLKKYDFQTKKIILEWRKKLEEKNYDLADSLREKLQKKDVV